MRLWFIAWGCQRMRRFSPIVRTGLLVALGVLILLPNVVFPYFEDTALLAAIGNYILQGDRLYVDVFDHKPPRDLPAGSLQDRSFGKLEPGRAAR